MVHTESLPPKPIELKSKQPPDWHMLPKPGQVLPDLPVPEQKARPLIYKAKPKVEPSMPQLAPEKEVAVPKVPPELRGPPKSQA